MEIRGKQARPDRPDRQARPDRRDRRLAAAGVALLAAALLLQGMARMWGGFATWYAHTVYPWIVGIAGRFFGIFPISVVEMLLYLLVFISAVFFARNIRQPVRIAGRALLAAGILFFLYTANCGVNYYAAPFSEYAGLTAGTYTAEELRELCEFLTDQVNANVTAESYVDNRAEWKETGRHAMEAAAVEFPCLAGYYPRPKEVLCSRILSVQQLCGIYAPFTVEANFNGDAPSYNVPHTICHELSHLRGFMREDEANFIGYLTCISSDSQAFRYSGYLTGWVYAGNALAGVDPEAYVELWRELDPQARKDMEDNDRFWRRYDGVVAEASNQWNDVYLKMNDQSDGVKSYGRMVDLMLAYAGRHR